jgi:hypothetical protein
MSIELSQYDELVARHNAAHAAHVEMFKAKRPLPPAPEAERADWLVVLALSIMVIASVIVSGSRTITEFGGGVVGAAAFAMLELGIVGAAYVFTRRNYDEARHQQVKRLTRAGMWLAFSVAVAANVHATLKAGGVEFGDVINLIILVAVAVSAPALALISGELLAMEAVANAARGRKAQAAYDAALAQWWADCNKAFEAQKSRLGVKVEISNPSNSVSIGTAGMESPPALPSNSTLGHSKTPNASALARQFFHDNSGALFDDSINLVEVAADLGIGKSTLYNVRNSMRAERR